MASSSSNSQNPDFLRRTSLDQTCNLNPTMPEINATNPRRTVDDVWKGIITGNSSREMCKVEVPDDMMTLEDFLVRAGAVDEDEVAYDVKVRVPLSGSVSAGVGTMSGSLLSFDCIPLSPFPSGDVSVSGSGVFGSDAGNVVVGRVKRRASGGGFEQLDKAAQKRQRRMIKNRESAARSRERKQEHQVQLELIASKLEEENAQLLKEKADKTKERIKLLMEKIVPIVEQRKPPRPLCRVRSLQW